MSEFNFIQHALIPIGCAFISGGLTLLGVKRTIKAQKKKDQKEYIRQIKPFLILESKNAIREKAEHGIEVKVLNSVMTP